MFDFNIRTYLPGDIFFAFHGYFALQIFTQVLTFSNYFINYLPYVIYIVGGGVFLQCASARFFFSIFVYKEKSAFKNWCFLFIRLTLLQHKGEEAL